MPATAPPAPPPAPLVLIYERHGPAERMYERMGRLVPRGGGGLRVVRQGPAGYTGVGPPRAGKVTSHDGTPSSPRLLGRTAAEMGDILADQIRRSEAHMVFVDELSAGFRGPDGDAFAQAMDALAAAPSPIAGQSMAERVHVYVPSPGWMLQDPGGWRAAFRALSLSRGVWLEAFRARDGRPTPWSDAEWATWPAAFRRLFLRAGGRPERLHLLVAGSGVARSFSWARRGAACAMLANGPGSYLTGPEVLVFLRELVADFGPRGDRRPECGPQALLAPGKRTTAASLLSLAGGAPAPARAVVAPRRLVADAAGTLVVRLGADPLGLARRLGIRPGALFGADGPLVRVSGTGVQLERRLRPGGVLRLAVHPRVPGPMLVELVVDGAAVRRWTGTVDLVTSLRPWRGRLKPISDRLVASPSRWDLVIPLRGRGTPGRGTVLVRPAG